MISISFDDKVKIGLQYVLESLHGCSPFGIERIRRLRFYGPAEREELETELYNVSQAAACAQECKTEYDKMMLVFCQMKDIRNSLRRCADGVCLDHVELFEIKGFLQRLDCLRPLLATVTEKTQFRGLSLHDVAPALAILDPENTKSRGFYIPDSSTPRLKALRSEKKKLEESFFHAEEKEKDAIRLERTKLCAEEDSEETKVRQAMGRALAPLVPDLLENAETTGRLDFLLQKALFAVHYGGILPTLTDGELTLTDMINPEICDLLSEKNRSFVPVSITLHRGATVITGANMGGKSVALKTVALNVLLLQAGFLVCAREARMPLFESVKMLFDDLQSIQSGLSGFGSEIVEFQKALEEVERGYSLFLLDEFARGTNPDEGAVIVQAVTRYLEKANAISILSTHYDKVAENAGAHYQIIGLRDIDPEAIRTELKTAGESGIEVIARHMNYGLYRVEGKSDCPRDALNICRMLSLKPEILASIESLYEA
jgi:DNA mismatch repair protein MutS2